MSAEGEPRREKLSFKEKSHWEDHHAVARYFNFDPADSNFLKALESFRKEVVAPAKVTEFLPLRFSKRVGIEIDPGIEVEKK